MPNIKSAKKRLITNEKARVRNKAKMSALRTAEKIFRTTVEAGNTDTAQKELSTAFAKLDRAVKAGIIHKNKAARKKSQLSALLKTKK